MTVQIKQAYVVQCDECFGATKERPLIVQAKDDWALADEWAKEHARGHKDKNRITDEALRKARVSRAAIAKMMSKDACQCFCPRVDTHTCAENDREVIVHFPYFILGIGLKASVMCTPCASAWMKRFKDTQLDPDPHTSYEVRMYDKGDGQKHVACFNHVTGEQLESADGPGSTDDARGEDSNVEEPRSSSGGDPDDGPVLLLPSPRRATKVKQADL